jgi:septal ring factor EnvC (AmiA/AmiB activator)
MRDIKFLESVIRTLEQEIERLENEVSLLRFQLEESDNANQAIGDTINKTLESFIMETMLSDKEPIGDA